MQLGVGDLGWGADPLKGRPSLLLTRHKKEAGDLDPEGQSS